MEVDRQSPETARAGRPLSTLPHADPRRLLFRSLLHQDLQQQPESRPTPPTNTEADRSPKPIPEASGLAAWLGGHRPHASRCRHLSSVRGGPVACLLETDDDKDQGVAAPFAWSGNVNTLWQPLDTLTGLEYASVVSARARRRQRRQQLLKIASAEQDGDVAFLRHQQPGVSDEVGQQLRGFARDYAVVPERQDIPPCAEGLETSLRRTPKTSSSRGRRSRQRLRRRPQTAAVGHQLLSQRAEATTEDGVIEHGDAYESEAELQELAVLGLLCQILRTDDPKVVRAWLAEGGATQRERALVADVVRTALAAWMEQRRQSNRRPASSTIASPSPSTWDQGQRCGVVDRLVIEHPAFGDGSDSKPGAAAEQCRRRERRRAASEWPILRRLPSTESSKPLRQGGKQQVGRLLTAQPPPPPPAAVPRTQMAKLRYTRLDPSLEPDARTGLAWRLRSPPELWARLA